jgi:hypothetical protein
VVLLPTERIFRNGSSKSRSSDVELIIHIFSGYSVLATLLLVSPIL